MWARSTARQAQRRYLHTHCRHLSVAALILIGLLSVGAVLVPGNFPRGFLLGAGLAGVGGVGWCWVVQVTGTAPTMMGDLAEQWTASELRPLRRHGWRVVNHLSLKHWDIDHVLIGPGGAFAVETKWSARPWVLDPPEDRVLRAVRQAEGNAKDLHLWGRFMAAGVPDVQPVLMLWGAGTGQLPTPAGGLAVRNTVVVLGPQAARWRAGLPNDVLTPAQVRAAWQALDRQASLRDAHEPRPVPVSVEQLVNAVVVTAVAAGLGFLAAATLLRLLGSLYIWLPACLALTAAAVPLRRYKHTRLPALGWQTGIAATLLLAAAAALLQA